MTAMSPHSGMGSPASSSGIESGSSNPPSPMLMDDGSCSDSGNESMLMGNIMLDRSRVQTCVFMLAIFAFNPFAWFFINSRLGDAGADFTRMHGGSRMLQADNGKDKSS